MQERAHTVDDGQITDPTGYTLDCTGLSPETQRERLAQVMQFTSLILLEIKNCDIVTSDDFEKIILKNQRLLSLKLENLHYLEKFILSSSEISVLCIVNCKALTEIKLDTPDLTNLRLRHLPALNSLDLVNHKLHKITINDCNTLLDYSGPYKNDKANLIKIISAQIEQKSEQIFQTPDDAEHTEIKDVDINDINEVIDELGRTRLHHAMLSLPEKAKKEMYSKTEIDTFVHQVEAIFRYRDLDVSVQDINKETPLHALLYKINFHNHHLFNKIIDRLIERGANIFLEDGKKKSSLEIAAEKELIAATVAMRVAVIKYSKKNKKINKPAFGLFQPHKKLHIVFDIDNTLCINLSDTTGSIQFEKLAYLEKNRLIINILNIPHVLFPGTIELIQYLLSLPNVQLSFFSSGEASRNTIFVKELITRAVGETNYHEIKNNIAIYSKHHLCDINLIYEIDTRSIFYDSRGQYASGIGCGALTKDLRVTLRNKEDELSCTILIDDSYSYAYPGQENNLLYADNRANFDAITENFKYPDETVLEWNHAFYLTGLLKHLVDQGIEGILPNLHQAITETTAEEPRSKFRHKDKAFFKLGLEVLKTFNQELAFFLDANFLSEVSLTPNV